MSLHTLPQIARLTRSIGALAIVALATACSDLATQPELGPTSYVNIVVSCDAAVQHDGNQWRVNYCTLALDGGMTGGALIMPGVYSAEKRTVLENFASCMNKHTPVEQQRCYAMIEG